MNAWMDRCDAMGWASQPGQPAKPGPGPLVVEEGLNIQQLTRNGSAVVQQKANSGLAWSIRDFPGLHSCRSRVLSPSADISPAASASRAPLSLSVATPMPEALLDWTWGDDHDRLRYKVCATCRSKSETPGANDGETKTSERAGGGCRGGEAEGRGEEVEGCRGSEVQRCRVVEGVEV